MPRLSKIGAAALAAFGWTSGAGVTNVTATYLQVAGGGGGGSNGGGGGGAGGYLTGTTSLNPTLSYAVIVGAGGAGGTSNAQGSNGSNSSFGDLTASVGGGGGGGLNFVNPAAGVGKTGGSGGGGGSGYGIAGGAGGSGTSGQGNAGGTGVTQGSESIPNLGGAGGGGAGATGSNGSLGTGGAGGAGTASSITGSSVTYAGGGAGGSGTNVGSGGSGGGGSGAGGSTAANSGTANLGGGGGGGGNPSTNGANGGSGVVIISYAGAQQFGGGIVSSDGTNTIHTFTTSGTLSPLNSLSASYLIVAGGAGGGNRAQRGGGGGGAGGLLSGSGLAIDTNSTYLVTVGAGGAGASAGANSDGVNGSNSLFGIVSTTAVGGGRGAAGGTGGSGGSGGGGDGTGNAGGTGTAGQGNNGGAGFFPNPASAGGGGGGAGAVGGTGSSSGSSGIGGNGGAGTASSISGTSVTYAGGGGGCGTNTSSTSGSGGSGGAGGGGAGAGSRDTGPAASAGTANTGGGGGGADTQASAAGGSGIVIISYAGSTQQMAGGSVTITGGNVIHTFTSSGYLTPLTYFSNSLRFRSSASAYLSRTPTVAGNRKTWTWSAWVKRGQFVGGMYQGYVSTSSFTAFGWGGAGGTTLFMQDFVNGSYNLVWETTALFRDPAAWYHVVFAYDSTQSSSANALKLYVNGVQQTLGFTAVSGSYTQNRDTFINATNSQQIGTYSNNVFQDGYMSNINFIDGQALTANSFGSFNQYGVWQPINYGGSYGTNGFYLPFNSGSQTYAGSFTFASSQVLSIADNAALELGSADFCVEGWYYPTSFSNNLALYSKRANLSATGAFIIYAGSGGGALTFYASSNGSTYFFSGTGFGTIALNQWNHFAVYRNGNSWYGAVNGVVTSMGSDSSAIFNNSEAWRIGGDSNGNYANGFISNTRIVTGSPVYTSANFIPSTSPLTAITGTQLLTLQNATIVDNSTNAFTITNTGSVTTATSKALSTAVFRDQSSQGNNWTPNNISGASGSTLDYMTDVPTLTSATASNYCTLNPLSNMGNGTISNGNLGFVSNAAAWKSAGGTMFVSSGKWYFEGTVTAFGSSIMLAICNTSLTNFNDYAGDSPNSWSVQGSTSGTGKWNNNSSATLAAGEVTAVGDVFMLAFDVDAAKVWFGRNGTWYASGDPAAGTNAAYTNLTGQLGPMVSSVDTSSAIALNCGQQPFKYTPPSGYLALNTYNL